MTPRSIRVHEGLRWTKGICAVTRRDTFRQTIDWLKQPMARLTGNPACTVNRTRRANVVIATNVRRRGTAQVVTARQTAPIVQDGPA